MTTQVFEEMNESVFYVENAKMFVRKKWVLRGIGSTTVRMLCALIVDNVQMSAQLNQLQSKTVQMH